MVVKATVQRQTSKQSHPKVSLKKELSREPPWNAMIKKNKMSRYQLSHTRFDQISDHKHDV